MHDLARACRELSELSFCNIHLRYTYIGASALTYMADNRRTNCAPYMNYCCEKTNTNVHEIELTSIVPNHLSDLSVYPMTLRDKQSLHFYMLLKRFCNLLRISDEWT